MIITIGLAVLGTVMFFAAACLLVLGLCQDAARGDRDDARRPS